MIAPVYIRTSDRLFCVSSPIDLVPRLIETRRGAPPGLVRRGTGWRRALRRSTLVEAGHGVSGPRAGRASWTPSISERGSGLRRHLDRRPELIFLLDVAVSPTEGSEMPNAFVERCAASDGRQHTDAAHANDALLRHRQRRRRQQHAAVTKPSRNPFAPPRRGDGASMRTVPSNGADYG